MNPELVLLANQLQDERAATTRTHRPQLRLVQPVATANRPSATPFTQEDLPAMNTFYFAGQSQLIIAETRHQELVRNAMRRQQLRDARGGDFSLVTTIRATVANALFTLAQAVKPAGEATPRPVA